MYDNYCKKKKKTGTPSYLGATALGSWFNFFVIFKEVLLNITFLEENKKVQS